jgi:hypothetical protein
VLAGQVLYHLSHASSPFCSGYFGDRISLFYPGQPGPQSSYFIVPAIAGMTGASHHSHLLVETGSRELFPQSGLDQWSSWSQYLKLLGLQVWATSTTLYLLRSPFRPFFLVTPQSPQKFTIQICCISIFCIYIVLYIKNNIASFPFKNQFLSP